MCVCILSFLLFFFHPSPFLPSEHSPHKPFFAFRNICNNVAGTKYRKGISQNLSNHKFKGKKIFDTRCKFPIRVQVPKGLNFLYMPINIKK